MGGDWQSKGCEFGSWHRMLDGSFEHFICCKLYCCLKKNVNKMEEAWDSHFFKKNSNWKGIQLCDVHGVAEWPDIQRKTSSLTTSTWSYVYAKTDSKNPFLWFFYYHLSISCFSNYNAKNVQCNTSMVIRLSHNYAETCQIIHSTLIVSNRP